MTLHRIRVLIAAAIAASLLLATGSPAAADNSTQSTDVLFSGGDATLRRTPNGLNAQFSVPNAPAGHMMTAWFVIFNNPEACIEAPTEPIKCGEYDLFVNQDVDITVTRLTGHVIGQNGYSGAGAVTVGSDPVGTNRVDWIFEAFGKSNGPLTNVDGAEVHLVFEDHGALDPALMPDEIHLAGAPVIGVALFSGD